MFVLVRPRGYPASGFFFRKNIVKLIHGDCLEEMSKLPDGCVDMVMADPPYGTTQCKWDSVIPLAPMWEQLKRVIKPNGTIVMTASQPFTTTLISSNIKMFKYCWVWEKTKAGNFIQVKNMPLMKHEDIVIFSDGVVIHKGQSLKRMKYNPQGVSNCNEKWERPNICSEKSDHQYNRPSHVKARTITQSGFPISILRFPSLQNKFHPTQKPVALMEYLINTYTNENETVLDFTMGSGTTGVACVNQNRKFIGIELDESYFDIATKRIANPHSSSSSSPSVSDPGSRHSSA